MLIAFILPAEGWISSPYGLRVDPFTKHWGFHRGVDVANHYAIAVKATESGTVLFAGKKTGYGKLVILEHNDGSQTYYGHLGRIFVGAGGSIAQGQLVGWMGMTGRATGAHVHYEVRQGGVAVDPAGVSVFQRSNVPIFQLENFWAILNENIFPPI